MQIETKIKYHFLPTRMAINKKTITSMGKYVEKSEPSYLVGGNVKWYNLGNHLYLETSPHFCQ